SAVLLLATSELTGYQRHVIGLRPVRRRVVVGEPRGLRSDAAHQERSVRGSEVRVRRVLADDHEYVAEPRHSLGPGGRRYRGPAHASASEGSSRCRACHAADGEQRTKDSRPNTPAHTQPPSAVLPQPFERIICCPEPGWKQTEGER